ncbi:MAG: peptidoglycan DD-metalloendopeptidase family protein [Proteobacteria bacterium]|nr:peptidoglycan DD-metalloendopeptidase family protein [Pseudomonadota bacterium]
MRRRLTNINKMLPARRRVVKWDNSHQLPPPTFLRSGLQRKNRSFFSKLLPLAQIFGLILILFIIFEFLTSRSFFREKTEASAPLYTAINFKPSLPTYDSFSSVHIVKKVYKGDNINKVIMKAGVAEDDAKSAADVLVKLQKDKKIQNLVQPKDSVFLVLEMDGQLKRVSVEPEPGKQLVAEKAKNGEFATRIRTPKQENKEQIYIGKIETSFAAAAMKAGFSYDVIDELVDQFSDRIDFNKDFRKGDRFTVVFRNKLLADGSISTEGDILAAALEIGGEHLVAIRYIGNDGKYRFFDEKGHQLGANFLRYPLKFSRISSYFADSRFHPVLKFARPHNGVDFAAPVGTPVRSVADGVVLFAGRNNSSGNWIKIKHSDRFTTAYLHLSSISSKVKTGVKVRIGDVIGAVGMTGLATGPHLHYAFYDNEKYVDPLKIRLPTLDELEPGRSINPRFLKRALFTLEHFQTVDIDGYLKN